MFGVPISLKYKNDTVYRTACGGIVSIIAYCSYILFILFKLKAIVERETTVTDS